MSVTLNGLTVVFGRTIALDAVTLEIEQGISGLFGPNGSGKTTLLRALSGLLRPTRGTIALDGRPVRAADEGFRRRVGYAGHETGLYRHLTVAENLALFATLHGAPEARVSEVIERLALTEQAGVRSGALSAGQKRRAAVARALLHEPDLLLLDEPYANLDDDSAELVSEALKAWRAPGRYGVVATHGAKRLKPFIDASIVLRRGELASQRGTQVAVQT